VKFSIDLGLDGDIFPEDSLARFAHEPTDDGLDNFFAETSLAAHGVNAEALAAETSERDEQLAERYRKIAKDAQKAATPKLELTKRRITDDETRSLVREVLLKQKQAFDEDEGSPLSKSAVSSSMLKTLAGLRGSLTPEEITAAEKAIGSLDIPAFLEILRRAQAAAA